MRARLITNPSPIRIIHRKGNMKISCTKTELGLKSRGLYLMLVKLCKLRGIITLFLFLLSVCW